MGDNLLTVPVGTGLRAQGIMAGDQHTCATLVDDQSNTAIKCWGANGYGQLGQGDSGSRGGSADQMGNNLPAINLGL